MQKWKYCDDAHREAIMTELTSYCDIVLGNEEDAEKHFGIHPEDWMCTSKGMMLKQKISYQYANR